MSTNNAMMLDVRNLSKRFGDFYAVKDLSFQVMKGEIFGFLGPNGAGKTTTMRVLTCFIPATSGTVQIDGLDTCERSLDIRRRIGYLAENNPLYSDMRVREYLLFVGELRGLRGQVLDAALDRMVHACGLAQTADRQIGKLSKGYQQRVGLAQAMIHNPELLVLDEPMSGLDPNQIVEIRELIKRIGREKTVVYCSHILSEVSQTCSRILIINNGLAVATGTPDELTARSTKANRYSVRIHGEKEVVEARLRELPGVSSVSTSAAGEWQNVTITAEGREDIGESLFKCVVDNNWSLAELKLETASLEDVFTHLTRS